MTSEIAQLWQKHCMAPPHCRLMKRILSEVPPEVKKRVGKSGDGEHFGKNLLNETAGGGCWPRVDRPAEGRQTAAAHPCWGTRPKRNVSLPLIGKERAEYLGPLDYRPMTWWRVPGTSSLARRGAPSAHPLRRA